MLISMPILIDGRKAREKLLPALKEKIKNLLFIPTLSIIQVGNRHDSTAFIAAKRSFAKKIGVREIHIKLPENISEIDLIKRIKECNADRNIHGLIVQLPLPPHIDQDKIINSIDKKKDADGLISPDVTPATARGIRELLAFYEIPLSRKKVTVLGQSVLVGKPIAKMCRDQGAIVMVCDSRTPDIKNETKKADIIISAVGKPGLLNIDHVSTGQIIIDVGITRIDEENLVGDVYFESVKDIVYAITPVPGGVGPMTVFALFENLIDLCSLLR
jgi:methylenetetrahydrofolate dehydrogenase (NADP+)/methenyltetrahydrofolate cyclohydrolase